MTAQQITQLNQDFAHATAQEILHYCCEHYGQNIVFSTSLGVEDQMLTHIIASDKLPIEFITLDTGRLFPETYSLMERTREKYNIQINIYFPDAAHVEAMVNTKGVNLFYESIESRKLCCHIRKIEPLQRALQGKTCWVTGLRGGQSEHRADMQIFDWDDEYGLLKVNPLIKLTEEDVWSFVRSHHVPYNKLHDKNFKSIGCCPCTRAVNDDEDARAGRWWWEDAGHKECGLHER